VYFCCLQGEKGPPGANGRNGSPGISVSLLFSVFVSFDLLIIPKANIDFHFRDRGVRKGPQGLPEVADKM